MSEKQRFQEVLTEIRSDIKFLQGDLSYQLQNILKHKRGEIDSEVKDWIYDVFLDKFYEIDAKIKKIINDLGYKPKLPTDDVKRQAELIARKKVYYYYTLNDQLYYLKSNIESYGNEVESIMSSIRLKLYEKDWSQIKNLKSEDYVMPIHRVKYVQARDELEKAKKAVKDKQWDEVLNHLRPAIDLAIKEKFGFKKIQPMKQFLRDAEKYNLPLPSYTMLYDYFDEGSQRIHEGKLNTPYECQRALEFVAGFIDRLESAHASQKDIDEFKKKSKAVE
jgi:hypothetical protein